MKKFTRFLLILTALTGLALAWMLTPTAHPATPARAAGETPASTLTYNPPSLEDTVTLGNVVSHTLTLEATGPDAVEVTLSPYTTLLDRVYGIYATFTDPHVAYFKRNDPGTLTDLGLFPGGSAGGDFAGSDFSKVYALDPVDPFDPADDTLVAIDTTTGVKTTIGSLGQPNGFENYGDMSWDPVTNKMYTISSYVDFFGTGGNTLYTIDLATGQATALGSINTPDSRQLDGIAFDENGTLYAYDTWFQELLILDPVNLTLTGVAPFDVWTEFNPGMDWDPVTHQLYISIWRSVEGGELRTVDLTTGFTTLVGSLGSIVPGTPEEIGFSWIAFASASAPWLSVAPSQVTVPANGNVAVDVVMDTRQLYQLDTYEANISFSGIFDTPVPNMPITMHVACATCGILNGSFTDAWTNAPVNAQLHATSNAGMDITLAPNTTYSFTVPADTYTLTATAPGYLDVIGTATATSGNTTTTDLALLPAAGRLEVDATAVDVTAEIGEVVTQTITVTNTGTIPLSFAVRMDNLDVPVAVQNATLSAIRGERAFSPEDMVTLTAYGINHVNVGGELGWFDLTDPTSLFTSGVYHDHGSLTGGDFLGEDYATLYGFEESRMIALDTATGGKTYVGALPIISPYTAYYAMAYDPLTEAMYFIHQYDEFTPPTTLYRVDPTTAMTTTVGVITGSYGYLGDMAFDDSGHLYAIDIDNNALIQIDPVTAAATTVGSLGFDIPTFEDGLAWDSATDQMYLTAVDPTWWPFIQKLYLVNLFTGETTYLSDIGTTTPGAGASYLSGLALQSQAIQWATLPAENITVPAGMTATFDLVFDTHSIYRTGDYTSDLAFEGTFVNDVPTVPVALHLSCVPCGTLNGSITADATGDPLPADLHITSPNGLDVELYNVTTYNLTVLPGDYTIHVFQEGYASQDSSVSVTANTPTTTDFALVAETPMINITPEMFHETVVMGTVVTRTFTLENLGLANFAFAVQDEDLDAVYPTPDLISCDDTVGEGYKCIDSNAPGGPSYNWVDIRTTGTSLGLDGANDYYGAIELPFDFPYFGNAYNQVAVSSYGQVYFEDRPADPYFAGNQPIPSLIEGDGVQTYIAPYWDSLNYDSWNNPQTFYEIQGIAPHRRLIIQWNNITANWANAITFQVILFEDSGNILMQYQTLNGDTGESATIGLQGSETTGVQYSYNTASLSDGLAICFVSPTATDPLCNLEPQDASWLTEIPANSFVPANGSTEVTVVFDATSVVTGTYTAEIYLGGTGNPIFTIPVTMEVVTELPQDGFQLYLPFVANKP